MSIAVDPDQTSRTDVVGTGASVRVNLLPEATRARSRAGRQRGIAGALGLALLAGLGATYWWATDQVTKAEAELAEAQVVTGGLRHDVEQLASFRELDDRRATAIESLTVALGDEVSVAGVLQDFALVVPPDTEFTTLNVQLVPDGEGLAIGSFALTGRTLTAHAPGVERTLLQLGKVASFRELYLNASALDDADGRVATFSLDGNVDESAATRRYADGLPEELR